MSRAGAIPAAASGRKAATGRGHGRCRGFTLIEILVALFVFAVVAAAVMGGLRSVLEKNAAVDCSMRNGEDARNCLQRMITDLSNIHVTLPPAFRRPAERSGRPDPFRVFGEIAGGGGTDFSRLRFVSLAHVGEGADPATGVARIVYYVQADAQGRWVLRRSDRLFPTEAFAPDGRDPVLCESVVSFDLSYRDGAGNDHARWDSESETFDFATPRAVRIDLSLGERASPAHFTTTVYLPVHRDGVDWPAGAAR